MFFKQIGRNAAKNRQDNGLFFGSLVVAIIAFYTLLSLESQDVIMFLKTLEGEAVQKLLRLIPIVYLISLFFVFFLVYFAYLYQLESRKREFGLYLILGMTRSRLFTVLMGETVLNSLISILIGLPISLGLTEAISLTISKLIGLSIISHRITFSATAIIWTIVGSVVVQMVAMFFLSFRFTRQEPAELLQSESSKKQEVISQKASWMSLIFGIILLLIAYGIGIAYLRTLLILPTLLIFVFGGTGTFLLYRGLGTFLGHRISKKGTYAKGLYAFTYRQVQENVLHQYKALAVASLLFLLAFAAIAFGMGNAVAGNSSTRTADFTLDGNQEEIQQFISEEKDRGTIAADYPVYLSLLRTPELKEGEESASSDSGRDDGDKGIEFSWDGLITELRKQPQTGLTTNMIENGFSSRSTPYLIAESTYNNLLTSNGKAKIQLKENQVALYSSLAALSNSDFVDPIKNSLREKPSVTIGEKAYELLPDFYTDNIIADRTITLYSALIVSDKHFNEWRDVNDDEQPYRWNVMLSPDLIAKGSLLQAIQDVEKRLQKTNLGYESYLSGIGRNLFYTIASSYLTLYIGILFIVIADTMVGLKFLMQQRISIRRYHTLLKMGASTEELARSARTQIMLFFELVLVVAIISSVFAIWSMFTSFLKLPANTSFTLVLSVSVIAILVLLVLEFAYIKAVERTSNREIANLDLLE